MPSTPWVEGTGDPHMHAFQDTLGGRLRQGTFRGDSDWDIFGTDSKLPYAAVNYSHFSGSSSAFLPSVGCKCPLSAVNVDSVCVDGRVESRPWQKKTKFQDQMMQGLLSQRGPVMPISLTEMAMMLRAAPLPAGLQ